MIERDVQVKRNKENSYTITETRKEELSAVDLYQTYSKQYADTSNLKGQLAQMREDIKKLDTDPLEIIKEMNKRAQEDINKKISELEETIDGNEKALNNFSKVIPDIKKDCKQITKRKERKQRKELKKNPKINKNIKIKSPGVG